MVRGSKAGSGKIRWACYEGHGANRVYCYQTTNPKAPCRKQSGKSVEPEAKIEFKQKGMGQTVVITWAQNATPIHKGFVLGSLPAFCKERNATLIVIPGRYKNATSRWTASQENEQWWDKALTPFLHNQRTKLNKNLVLLGDISTQPTAVTPLSGFESITHGESGILGHPKLQMTVIPTPHQRLPKILTTTGACTVANYTDSKAGKKGGFHHVIGAVVVELDGGVFHLRHINARGDGAFVDLDKAYYPDGSVLPAGQAEACVFGDTHVRFTDPAVTKATFGPGGLVERLNPKTLIFHDLLDSYAVNPHHFGKPFISVAKFKASYAGIKAEVVQAVEWLIAAAKNRETRIIASNHNDFLSRWMNTQDWRFDPENAEFYLETALHMVRSASIKSHGASTADPFQYWVSKLVGKLKHIRCINRNESLMIGGIELSLHGDQGPNGSRGSRANLSRIGVKTMIGHSHAPGITEGCYQVGTSTPPRLEYTGAVSSALQCHGSVDCMGKRHLHILVNGAFWR